MQSAAWKKEGAWQKEDIADGKVSNSVKIWNTEAAGRGDGKKKEVAETTYTFPGSRIVEEGNDSTAAGVQAKTPSIAPPPSPPGKKKSGKATKTTSSKQVVDSARFGIGAERGRNTDMKRMKRRSVSPMKKQRDIMRKARATMRRKSPSRSPTRKMSRSPKRSRSRTNSPSKRTPPPKMRSNMKSHKDEEFEEVAVIMFAHDVSTPTSSRMKSRMRQEKRPKTMS